MIPILNKLMGKAKKLAAPRPNPATYRPGIDPPCRAEPLVVVVCPSRELAIQIFNEARKLCYRSMLRPVSSITSPRLVKTAPLIFLSV